MYKNVYIYSLKKNNIGYYLTNYYNCNNEKENIGVYNVNHIGVKQNIFFHLFGCSH